MFVNLCYSVVVSLVCFVLVEYMEVVMEPNTMSDRIKVFLDDPQWPKHIKDPSLKQIKRQTSSNI